MSFAFFRTRSMREPRSSGGRDHREISATRKVKSAGTRTGSPHALSISMDNILLPDGVMDGWFPGASSFSRTEELQCVFIPDNYVIKDMIGQPVMMTTTTSNEQCRCSYPGEAARQNKSIKRRKSCELPKNVAVRQRCESARSEHGQCKNYVACMSARLRSERSCSHEPQTRLRSFSETCTQARTSANTAGEPRNCGTASAGVQSRRCLSLYERGTTKRNNTQHSCSASPPKTLDMSSAQRPKPNDAGDSQLGQKQVSPRNSKSIRRRFSGPISPKSLVYGSKNRSSSGHSLHSCNSTSDLDLRTSPRSSHSNGSQKVLCASGTKSPLTEKSKPTFIPRPVKTTSGSAKPRLRSNSVEEPAGKIKVTRALNGQGRTRPGRPVKDAFVTRSVPTTPSVTETKGVFFSSGNKHNSDSSSTETLSEAQSQNIRGLDVCCLITYNVLLLF